jgi:hypothetical protein
MNKNLVIGLVVVAGIGLYLYNRNKKQNTTNADMNFANVVSSNRPTRIGNVQIGSARANGACGGCPANTQCMEVIFPNGNRGFRCVDTNRWVIVK